MVVLGALFKAAIAVSQMKKLRHSQQGRSLDILVTKISSDLRDLGGYQRIIPGLLLLGSRDLGKTRGI